MKKGSKIELPEKKHTFIDLDDLGDFIIQRRDKLFAYQLAVVLDDAEQGINQVVRGYDILESTPRQLQLIQHLDLPQPQYAHIPVITKPDGQKLSKQNRAPAIHNQLASHNLQQALEALNHPLPKVLHNAPVDEIIKWAIQSWSMDRLPKGLTIQGGWHTGSEL